MVIGNGQQIDLETGEIGLHSTPTVVEGRRHRRLVVARRRDGRRRTTTPRGSCARSTCAPASCSGTFNTIPRPGEFGNDTWENDSWAVNGNAGVWTQITVDEELGLVYLPVETPTSDYYGGHRPGNNLFAESLVCVDLKTGQREVALPVRAPSDLELRHVVGADPRRHHRRRPAAIKAVARAEQAGVALRLRSRHRRAVWPIEETAGAAADVPGEKTRRRSRIRPSRRAYARNCAQGAGRPDRLHAGAARAGAREHRSATSADAVAMLQPADRSATSTGCSARSTSASSGGTNWPGGGYDPETAHRLCARRTTSAFTPSRSSRRRPGFSDIRVSCRASPGSRSAKCSGPATAARPIAARDASRGERAAGARRRRPAAPPAPAAAPQRGARRLRRGRGAADRQAAVRRARRRSTSIAARSTWQVPHGDTPDNVRNHPALKGLNIPKTGQAGSVGVGCW